jgi:hypothetical protein
MIANEEWAYEAHVVLCLHLNLIRPALRLVHAHSIDKQMGMKKVLHSTEPRDNMLHTKCPIKLRCLHDKFKGAYCNPLLTEFKDVVEQGLLDCLSLAKQTSMGCLLVLAGPNQGNEGIINSALLLLPLDNEQMGYKKTFCCPSERKPFLMLQALHSG